MCGSCLFCEEFCFDTTSLAMAFRLKRRWHSLSSRKRKTNDSRMKIDEAL
ncbi:unnamed protein product [Chondrus crispus]|uniref:Uncharacterized protein n=1 Tax=Chondrus crispus TaxID=2769 RepID=R7QA92_CHOCR|nr:unnamed protein product [Chondrus crispus]CDF34336.1 unnamed protein product [Chondrus crispus]|eukprot:XP_005714155.1 unnamed protein product [Chondrus crispus]